MTLPTLETPRLRLRHIDAEDVDALLALFGDRDLTRFWGHAPLSDVADARRLAAEIHEGAEAGTLMQWGVTPVGDDVLVGTCTLAAVNAVHARAELGILMGRDHQGKGLALEAASAVLDFAFNHLQLHRVTADVDPRNDAALRLMERLGFEEEGRLRQHYRHLDEWQDGVLFGLLRPDWKRR